MLWRATAGGGYGWALPLDGTPGATVGLCRSGAAPRWTARHRRHARLRNTGSASSAVAALWAGRRRYAGLARAFGTRRDCRQLLGESLWRTAGGDCRWPAYDRHLQGIEPDQGPLQPTIDGRIARGCGCP